MTALKIVEGAMRRPWIAVLVAAALLVVMPEAGWGLFGSSGMLITASTGGGGGPPAGDPTTAFLPADRDAWPNWKMAGLQSIGGIPSRTVQCGAQLSPTGSDATPINNAISACPAGQYVSLASGTFTIPAGSKVTINKGVTVRGQGAGNTILQHPPGSTTYSGGNCSGAGAWGATLNTPCPGNNPSAVVVLGGGVGFGSPITLSANTVAGSSTVSVSSAAGISVGSLVNLDELGNGASQPSPDWITSGGAANAIWASGDYSTVWNAHSPTIGSFDSAACLFGTNNFACGSTDPTAYSIRAGGVIEEYHLVSGVSGTAITFDSPVMRVYHTANSAALTVFTAANEVQQAGLENLTVAYGDNDNIDFQGCIYCWASGVESTKYLNPGIHFQQGAFRDYLTNFWAHEGAWPVNGGGGYNITLTYGPSEILIDNGISMKANKCITMRASGAGSVVAYNYMDDQYIGGNASWVETCLNNSHMVAPGQTLFEGNRSSNADSDYTHGAVSYNTLFRNYLTGIRETWTSNFDGTTRNDGANSCCSPMRAASSHPYTYRTSFIGNILGTAGVTTPANGWDYQNNAFTNKHLLMLGWNDANVGGANVTGPDNTANVIYPADPRTACGTTGRCASSNGCMSGAFPCTTIVTGNYDYVNAAQSWDSRGVQALPNSFYLTAAPSWFSGFTWPPFNPAGPVINDIPAHARWAGCAPTPSTSCLFPSGPPTISGVTLANGSSFNTPAAAGSLITPLQATCSNGSCAGATFSLPSSAVTGCTAGQIANNSAFAISGSNLNAGGSTVNAGTYAVGIQVTLAGATNTPQCYPQTLTGANPPATAWDATHKSSTITLTNSNLTATTSGSADAPGYGNNNHVSGRFAFAVTINTLPSNNIGVGVGTAAAPTTSGAYCGSDNNSLCWFSNGTIHSGNAQVGTSPTFAAGSKVWIAIDKTDNLGWIAVSATPPGTTGWIGAGGTSGNPDNGTSGNGFNLSALGSAAFFPGYDLFANTGQITADFTTASGLSTYSAW